MPHCCLVTLEGETPQSLLGSSKTDLLGVSRDIPYKWSQNGGTCSVDMGVEKLYSHC